jgi:hypothetical protein
MSSQQPRFPSVPPVAPQYPAPAAPPGRRRPTQVLVALAVMGGLIVGGALGAVCARLTATAVSEPTGPQAPPPIDADFPNEEQNFLPGVTVDLIAQRWLKAKGYTCAVGGSYGNVSGARHRMLCELPGSLSFSQEVLIEYDDDTHVRRATGRCELRPGASPCRTLFADLAYTLLHSDTALRDQARDWAGKNVDTDNSTTIGGVRFQVSLEPHTLVGEPAER